MELDIKANYKNYDCGLFFTRNSVGDTRNV